MTTAQQNPLKVIQQSIRDIPDFPKPGIIFKDITPLLGSPPAFKAAIQIFLEHYQSQSIDAFVAVESRGFLFGSVLAYELGVPLIIVRKPGKLPYKTVSIEYLLEYGSGTLEMHEDSIRKGMRVVVIDDLLATGGTAAATSNLIQKQGGQVVEQAFVIELSFLRGREKLAPTPVFSILTF